MDNMKTVKSSNNKSIFNIVDKGIGRNLKDLQVQK